MALALCVFCALQVCYLYAKHVRRTANSADTLQQSGWLNAILLRSISTTKLLRVLNRTARPPLRMRHFNRRIFRLLISLSASFLHVRAARANPLQVKSYRQSSSSSFCRAALGTDAFLGTLSHRTILRNVFN